MSDVTKAVGKAMGGDMFKGGEPEKSPTVHRRTAKPKVVGAKAKPSAHKSWKPPRLGRRTTRLDEARGEILDLLEEHGFLFRDGAASLQFMADFSLLVRKHFYEVKGEDDE